MLVPEFRAELLTVAILAMTGEVMIVIPPALSSVGGGSRNDHKLAKVKGFDAYGLPVSCTHKISHLSSLKKKFNVFIWEGVQFAFTVYCTYHYSHLLLLF